jgi:hypothetical protein
VRFTNTDVITNFALTTDKLDLDVTTLLGDLGSTMVFGVTFTVTDGVAAVTGTPVLDDVLTALVTQIAANKQTVAFVSGTDTYVFQGDGVSGLQDSDVLVKLAGVAVTDLGAILI